MGYVWESLKADNVYAEASQYVDGLISDCGMSSQQAYSWTANLLKPFLGGRRVNIYLCPPMIGPFDDYEAVPDLDVQFAIESLRDAAYRGTDHCLGGLFFSKKEIISHSKNICHHKGVPIESAPMPQCLLPVKSNQAAGGSVESGRISMAAKVAIISLYEHQHGQITNYERAAVILTSEVGRAGYSRTFDAETLKRWKAEVMAATKARAA